ncbi:putative F-box protein At1g32420 [Papaver somniferum]|uniref:putative F-box protein At1g32420 n=1 Tax=Papaver somniferum TaxID=3469 RepID=UPI000E70599E|nr:putative F-box protein At1g32420 [Papaver somniferum]
MDYIKTLPAEITVNILSRLPAELILECKSVSKSWNRLISHHRSFNQVYLHHLFHPCADSGKLSFLSLNEIGRFHYFEYNESTKFQKTRRVNMNCPFRFAGSCNGLICVAQESFVCICNPITREYVVLPEFNTGSDINFGYVSSTNEYKVVGVGSGKGWRNLGDLKSHGLLLSYRGVFTNGALYWIDRGSKVFIIFELAEEKFCENLKLPPSAANGGIGVLDGILYVAVGVVVDGVERCFDIWVLKQKSVNHEASEQQGLQSWSKEFRIGDKELLAVTKSGAVLTWPDKYINIYDAKTSTPRRLVKSKNHLDGVYPHRNTLVSLKELGEEDIKVMKSIEIEETKSSEQPSKQLPQHFQHKKFNFKKACGI